MTTKNQPVVKIVVVVALAAVVFLAPLAVVLAVVTVLPAAVSCKVDPFAAVGSTVDLPATPVPTSRPGAALQVRVASWNTYANNTTGQVLAGMREMTRVADVIGVQELKDNRRRTQVEHAMARRGFRASPGRNAVPLFWRTARYRTLTRGSVKVFGRTRIEPGISGTRIGPKSIQFAQLQDRRTGAVFTVLNHHLVPDIEHDGHAIAGHPRRVALADRQLDAFATLAARFGRYGPVIGTGDWNINAETDQRVRDPHLLSARLARVGMATNWAAVGYRVVSATKGRRYIDSIVATTRDTRIDGVSVGSYDGSDHKKLFVTLHDRYREYPVAHHLVAVVSARPTPPPPARRVLPDSLLVRVGGQRVRLNRGQIRIAATVIAEGEALGIPARGWLVALAAAGAESGIRNLSYGDRDSVGVWQMRPSAGWGTVRQIQNVRLATRAFYGRASHTRNPGLTDIVDWQRLTVAQAAQAVEVSAHPDAYVRWEPAARTLVDRLTGTDHPDNPGGDGTYNPDGPGGDLSGLSCAGGPATEDVDGGCPGTNLPAEQVLTPDGLLVLRCVAARFPAITNIATYPGHQPDQSRAVDIMIPGWQSSAGRALGTRIAGWVRAHHAELGVQYVIWDGRIWNTERDREGWRRYFDADNPDPNRAHTTHVHVSVYGYRGTGPTHQPVDRADGGVWHAPVGQPSRIGCSFGCYTGHTGQDYSAPVGTPVYAVTAGTVVRSESITSRGRCTARPVCGTRRVSYGNLIVLRLAGGHNLTAWYAHLSARQVTVGDTVRAGQVIGAVGYEGHVIPAGPAGAHLHFEIRHGGKPVDPIPYLRRNGVRR